MKNGLSGFSLKCLALLFMTLDHLYQFWGDVGIPMWCTWLGRLAAPLFLFMVVEGFAHTRSVARYAVKLYLSFVLMNVLSTLVMQWYPRPDGKPLDNNIFETFFLLVVLLWFLSYCQEKFIASHGEKKARPLFHQFWAVGAAILYLVVLIVVQVAPEDSAVHWAADMFLPNPVTCEGGIWLLVMGVCMYLCRGQKLAFCISYAVLSVIPCLEGEWNLFGLLSTNFQWMMLLALPLLLCYNGQKGKGLKCFFYAYYPAHLCGFYLLSSVLLRQQFPK